MKRKYFDSLAMLVCICTIAVMIVKFMIDVLLGTFDFFYSDPLGIKVQKLIIFVIALISVYGWLAMNTYDAKRRASYRTEFEDKE